MEPQTTEDTHHPSRMKDKQYCRRAILHLFSKQTCSDVFMQSMLFFLSTCKKTDTHLRKRATNADQIILYRIRRVVALLQEICRRLLWCFCPGPTASMLQSPYRLGTVHVPARHRLPQHPTFCSILRSRLATASHKVSSWRGTVSVPFPNRIPCFKAFCGSVWYQLGTAPVPSRYRLPQDLISCSMLRSRLATASHRVSS